MAKDAGTNISEEFDSHIFCDYTGKPWQAEELSKLLQSETAMFGLSSINVSSYRHMAIAISRRFLREDLDEDESNTNAHDAQANHSTRTANRVYGRPEELTSQVSAWQLAEMAPISMAWWSWHLDREKESYKPRRIFVKFNNMSEVDGQKDPGVNANTVILGEGQRASASRAEKPHVTIRDMHKLHEQSNRVEPIGSEHPVGMEVEIAPTPGPAASGVRYNMSPPPTRGARRRPPLIQSAADTSEPVMMDLTFSTPGS